MPIWQKIIGGLIYMIPWSDALPFGKYLFIDIPSLTLLLIPALPILFIEQIIPFGGLVLFLLLFIFVIRNPKIPYFIRFNSLQAILLNIGLIILNYIFEIFLKPFENSLLVQTFSSTILIAVLAIISFSIYKCLEGKEPDLPGISDAVKIQL